MNNYFFDLIKNKPPVFFLIAGPCVIEDYETSLAIASHLKQVTGELGIPYIFKASYDKANRTALSSFRGPGPEQGLDILRRIKETLQIPVISDIHLPDQAQTAAEVLDVIQIPAFLCRQTDLIIAACSTGKPVNIKKGQFLAPADCANIIAKATSTGNTNIAITERGTSFGYNNLVVDFQGISHHQRHGCTGNLRRHPQRPAARRCRGLIRRGAAVCLPAVKGCGGGRCPRSVHGNPPQSGQGPVRRPQLHAPGPDETPAHHPAEN